MLTRIVEGSTACILVLQMGRLKVDEVQVKWSLHRLIKKNYLMLRIVKC